MAKQLDRTLGFWSVFSIASAAIGAGVFVLPGLAAGISGPHVGLAYLLAGVLALPAILAMAELATAMPVSGGIFVYVDRAMGPWLGTITGLGTWGAMLAKTAFAALGTGAYLAVFSDVSPLPVALAILVALTLLNLIGVGKVSGLQIAVVAGCLAALIALGALGVGRVQAVHYTADGGGIDGIFAGAAFVFISYKGITKVSSVAEEVRHPDRNLPLGMLGGLLLVMALYVGVGYLLTGVLPVEVVAEDIAPMATLGGAIAGTPGRTAMGVMGVVALASMCNAGLLAASRFPFAMSRAHLLPESLSRVSTRYGTPYLSILLSGALLVALVTVLPVAKLAKLASGFGIFLFIIANVAVVVLRESHARWYKPTFVMPLYPVAPVVGGLGGIWLLASLGGIGVAGVGVAVLAGTAWYFAYALTRQNRTSALRNLVGEVQALRETEDFEHADELTNQGPRVIVPLVGKRPEVEHLVRLASTFVEVGLLEVLLFEEVAQQVPLSQQLRESTEERELARLAHTLAEELELDLEFHDIVTHNAMRALFEHARATRAGWIVMRWPEDGRLTSFVRHPLDRWLEKPPCDLAIYKERRGGGAAKEVLVLAEPGPYDTMVVHVADRLARGEGGQLTLLALLPAKVDALQVQQQKDYHVQLMQHARAGCRSMVLRTDEPYDRVAELSDNFDLLVMGSPEEQGFKTVLFGSHEHRMADAVRCSVLRLETPRPDVHHRYALSAGDHDTLALRDYLDASPIRVEAAGSGSFSGRPVRKKQELFADMAYGISVAGGLDDPEPVLRAMLERDRRQNTALSGGVAMLEASVRTLAAPVIGVSVLAVPVDYRGRERRRVDVMFCVAASARHRQVQLWILDRLARMILTTDVLDELRDAETNDEARRALTEADELLDRRLVKVAGPLL